MPIVDDALIRKISDLARLELSEEEISAYLKSTNEVLGYVEQLNLLSTHNIKPMLHGTDEQLRYRADEVQSAPEGPEGYSKILQSAPEVIQGGIKVPPVL